MGKARLTIRIIVKVLKEVLGDILRYYFSNYPILLVLGGFRRIQRRLKHLWIPTKRGRPPISDEIIDLILEMKRSNWGWGSLRISQELALLGIKVSKTKVAQILRENGLVPPKTKVSPISWEAFYQHHKHIWSIDFTSIFDRFGNQLFVFSIVDIASRQLKNINITGNPDRLWVLQQFRNASMQSDRLPDWVVCDNDGIYGAWLETDLEELFSAQLKRIPPKRPWLNPYVERFQQSLKSECLGRVEFGTQETLRESCLKYQDYYNRRRPHQGIGGNVPKVQVAEPIRIKQNRAIKFKKHLELDGLVTRFSLVA